MRAVIAQRTSPLSMRHDCDMRVGRCDDARLAASSGQHDRDVVRAVDEDESVAVPSGSSKASHTRVGLRAVDRCPDATVAVARTLRRCNLALRRSDAHDDIWRRRSHARCDLLVQAIGQEPPERGIGRARRRRRPRRRPAPRRRLTRRPAGCAAETATGADPARPLARRIGRADRRKSTEAGRRRSGGAPVLAAARRPDRWRHRSPRATARFARGGIAAGSIGSNGGSDRARSTAPRSGDRDVSLMAQPGSRRDTRCRSPDRPS